MACTSQDNIVLNKCFLVLVKIWNNKKKLYQEILSFFICFVQRWLLLSCLRQLVRNFFIQGWKIYRLQLMQNFKRNLGQSEQCNHTVIIRLNQCYHQESHLLDGNRKKRVILTNEHNKILSNYSEWKFF